MQDVEQLIQRYEMGLAYLRITEEMGPCPQLTAFVSYNNTDTENTAMESLDADAQHLAIVDQIHADPALDLACESLSGRLKSGLERTKNFITRNKHSHDITRFTRGKLAQRDSNIYVETQSEFSKLLDIHVQSAKLMSLLLKKIPRSHHLDDWEAFAKKSLLIGSLSEFSKNSNEIDVLEKHIKGKSFADTGDFAQAGWTGDKFRQAIKAYESAVHNTVNVMSVTYTTAETIDDLMIDLHNTQYETSTTEGSEYDKDENEGRFKESKRNEESTTAFRRNHALVIPLRAMNAAHSALFTAVFMCDRSEKSMLKILKDVSHHFTPVA